MGMVMQQTGYQVGDFLVQVQSGTNFMVAFGQQATQLAGILPLLGAGFMGLSMTSLVALSAGLGIAIPLFTAVAAGIMRTNQAAKDAEGGIGSLSERVNNAVQSIGRMNRELEVTRRGLESVEQLDLVEGIEAQEREVQRLQQRIERINNLITRFGGREQRGALVERLKAEEELLQLRQEQLQELTDLLALEKERDAAEDLTRRNQEVAKTTLELQNQIRLLEITVKFGRDSVQVEQERNRQARAALVTEQLRAGASADQIISMLALLRRTQDLNSELDNSSKSTKTLADEMSRAANEALRFISNLNSSGGVNAAVGRVAGLRAELAARQGGAGDIAAAEARARAEVMARPEFQLAMQGPTGVQEEAQSGLDAAVREARLQAEAQILQGQISGLGAPPSAGGGGQEGPNAVERLQEEITFRMRILNLSEDERNLQTEIFRITQALGKDRNKYSSDFIENLAQQNLAIQEQERVIEEARQQQEQLADSIANSFGDAFMSVVDGTKSTKDAFRSMAADIIKELYRVLVVQRMVGAISGALGPGGSAGGFLGSLFGGRESGGSMMANRPYLVGERGPELVIPGRSGTVVNADLTNKAMGGSNGVTVVNNINVSGGTDPAAIRQEVAKLMPQITNATKSAVIDARRRGGQMKAAFG
jgi:hypothetical protein